MKKRIDGAKVGRFEIEYDMFGPWIFEIKKPEDIPAHFEKYVKLNTNIIYAIKIPKNKDRRDLKPGMELYDKILLFSDNYLQFVKKDDESVKSYRLEYSQILSIQNTKNQLKGKLILYTKDHLEKIDYNVVSSDKIDLLIDIIRKGINKDPRTVNLPTQNEKNIALSYFYKNVLEKLKKKESIEILEYQPDSILERLSTNIFYKLKDKFYGNALHGKLFLTNNQELIIINTVDELKGYKKKGYKYIITYIPFNCIQKIELINDDIYRDINNMNIIMSNNRVDHSLQINRDANINSWVDMC